MKAMEKRQKRRIALCLAAVLLLLPATALADVSLDLAGGAISFGGDSAAGTTIYTQGANVDVAYSGTATVTGAFSGPETAITVSGGDHTIVLDGVVVSPAALDSGDPCVLISGGEQDITIKDTLLNAGDSGAGLVVDGGQHDITLDDLTVNGSGSGDSDAGIIVKGGAEVSLQVQEDSIVAVEDAPAMSIVEDASVAVSGGGKLSLHASDADGGGALTGDGTGTLAVNSGMVEAQVVGTQAPVQGVEVSGYTHTRTGTGDGTGQTVTTTIITSEDGSYYRGKGLDYIIEELYRLNAEYGVTFWLEDLQRYNDFFDTSREPEYILNIALGESGQFYIPTYIYRILVGSRLFGMRAHSQYSTAIFDVVDINNASGSKSWGFTNGGVRGFVIWNENDFYYKHYENWETSNAEAWEQMRALLQ